MSTQQKQPEIKKILVHSPHNLQHSEDKIEPMTQSEENGGWT